MAEFMNQLISGEATEANWKKYFINKNTELDTEYTNLVYGTKTRIGNNFRKVGYQKLRDFFDGDQWDILPEGGQATRVFNFCRSVVLNYTAFMTNEPLEIDIPPIAITDEIEVARAEAKEKVIGDIFEDNDFDLQFEMGVQNGSLLGDTIFLGPFYLKDDDRITFFNVKRPENVRIIWEDDSYTGIFGFIHHYYISTELATSRYGEVAKEKEVTFESEQITFQSSNADQNRGSSPYDQSGRRMVKVMDCWTADVHQLIVGNQVLSFENHEWGFVPITHVLNMPHPEEPYGISDIEDLLDAQVDFNEKTSDLGELINQTAYPYLFGKNLNPAEIKAGLVNLIDMGDEAEFLPDPRVKRSDDLNAELSRRLSTIYQISGLNENIFGGAGVRAVTGRALSVLMQTVNNRIKGRQHRWALALRNLVINTFKLIEKYTENGKELVGGFYRADIFFPGTLVRNITDEINKFNAKLQSGETTMKNLGIPSPKDEKRLMKNELEDMLMMIEISRNPALQIQVKQMMEQQAAQQAAGQKPQLSEDENMEEQPASAAGAPQQAATNLEGAMRQTGQRAGTSTPITERE